MQKGFQFAEAPGDFPSLELCLTVTDADALRELHRYAEGADRDQFALTALRIGVMALKQARGEIDGEQIRREGEKLLLALQSRLGEHAQHLHSQMTGTLREYFDPESGRFQERVNRLIRHDGDLERVLQQQIGRQDSELARTLDDHFGSGSSLMKLLDPTESQGLLVAFRATLCDQLDQQKKLVLREFSLDHRDSALARLVAELGEHHARLGETLQNRIGEVVREFSLDEENSALSRLVQNVERAQKTITREFSLDSADTALSRLKTLLEHTNSAIDRQLTLDDETSALSRLKRELLAILETHAKTSLSFQEEVKVSLASLSSRREEAARSTRHGAEFESLVCEQMSDFAVGLGDIATNVGATPGLISHRKYGDCVIELGPDSVAPGGRIVVEAKEDRSFHLARAREEIENARKNRDAQVGLFVFSKRTAPNLKEPLERFGQDVYVVWNPDDPASDLVLRAGFIVARALCVRTGKLTATQSADFVAMDKAVLEIEKRTASLGDIESWARTIQSRSDDILKQVELIRKNITKQIDILREKTQELKGTTTQTPAATANSATASVEQAATEPPPTDGPVAAHQPTEQAEPLIDPTGP